MLTKKQRCTRVLRKNSRGFICGIFIQACVICLLAQAILGYFCAVHWENSRSEDEATLFIEPKATDAIKKNIFESIHKLNAEVQLKELNAKELLSGRLSDLVKNRNVLPEVFQIVFPKHSTPEEIGGIAEQIKKLKGVSAVAVDLDWIEKSRSMKNSLVLGILILGVPLIFIAVLTFAQSAARLAGYFSHESSVVLFLGGKGSIVWGPYLLGEFLGWFYSVLLGASIFVIGAFLAIPLLFDALDLQGFLTVKDYGFSIIGSGVLSALFMFFFAVSEIRRTKTLLFSGER